MELERINVLSSSLNKAFKLFGACFPAELSAWTGSKRCNIIHTEKCLGLRCHPSPVFVDEWLRFPFEDGKVETKNKSKGCGKKEIKG